MYKTLLGETQHLEKGFDGTTTDFGIIATAFYGGLWAFDGWYENIMLADVNNRSLH